MYTINAVGKDGKTYAVYFECEDIIDAENLVKQTGLVPDEAGVCQMISEVPDRRKDFRTRFFNQ